VKKNPQSPMYTSLGVLTKGTVIEVNVSELGMVTAGGKVVFGKYAQVTNNPENDGCINAVLRACPSVLRGGCGADASCSGLKPAVFGYRQGGRSHSVLLHSSLLSYCILRVCAAHISGHLVPLARSHVHHPKRELTFVIMVDARLLSVTALSSWSPRLFYTLERMSGALLLIDTEYHPLAPYTRSIHRPPSSSRVVSPFSDGSLSGYNMG
jgi:hypothetical protein